MTRRVAGFLLWALLLLTAGVPLAWLAANLLLHSGEALQSAVPAQHHLAVFLRTLLLAFLSAAGATLLAIAPAAALAGRGWLRWLLWPVMAGLIVIPAPAWAYGWAEFIRQALGTPRPHSLADLARVVLTNATAFWPIPATAIAIAWRRLPAGVLDAAALDGAHRRVTCRLLAGPALAGCSAALLLSSQNLAAPDLSGIVVASVVVRDAFQLGGGDQSARLAAATALGLPSFLSTAALALLGWTLFRRSTDWTWADDPAAIVSPTASPPGRRWSRTRPGEGLAIALALLILAATLLPPIMALARTAMPPQSISTTQQGQPPRSLILAAVEAHGPALAYGLQLAAASAAACLVAGFLATIARPRGPLLLSIAAFLLGGQFLALGMIRAFNPPQAVPQLLADGLGALYDTPPYYAAAGIALFAWIVLATAAATWHGRWRALRDMADADGAGALQAGLHVLWPLAWPGLLAGGLAVMALCLTESQAAALMVPGTPMNFMLSNLHTLNYSAMAEASLLMAVVCGGAASAGVGAWMGVRAFLQGRAETRQRRVGTAPAVRPLLSLVSLISLLAVSCDRPPAPDAIWASGGSGDGQLAYPRAIAYSPADDTVWVVDKNARVQQFDSNGAFLQGWRMPDFKYGKPVGLSTDIEGNLWVADTHYYRVIVYRPDGTEWFRFGEQGTGPGQFGWPTDVLVLEDGRVLVSEYGGVEGESGTNDRIQVFQRSADGTITDAPRQVIGQIGAFGTGEGQFRRPQSMAIAGDLLWVTDGANHRLQAFSLDGQHRKTLGGAPGSAPGAFRFPYGLAVDNDGNLLVSEFGNHRVQKIDPETGQALAAWGGSFGGHAGQVKYPWGLAYDGLRDRVILLDSGNDRMQVVRLGN